MSEALNALPVQTYVRSRIATIITDIADDSSGSVTLSLAKPSDVTLILVSDPAEGKPSFFVAAVGRTPTLMDFDVIIMPLESEQATPDDRVTLRLPAMESALNWAAFDGNGFAQAFGVTSISRLILAVDQ